MSRFRHFKATRLKVTEVLPFNGLLLQSWHCSQHIATVMKTLPELLSSRRVREILGVCPNTLRRMEIRGQLKPFRLNSRVKRFFLKDVQAFIDGLAKKQGLSL